MAKDKETEQSEAQSSGNEQPKKTSIADGLKKISDLVEENTKKVNAAFKKMEDRSLKNVREIPGREIGIRNRHIELAEGLDPVKKNELLQHLAYELNKQKMELQQKMESDSGRISANDKALDALDEEIPALLMQIKEKKEDLAKRGISPEDKSNAFVRELSNLEDQKAIKNEIKESLMKENESLTAGKEADAEALSELEKQSRIIAQCIEANDSDRIAQAQAKAERQANGQHPANQHDSVLTALEALMQASEQFAKIRAAKDDAASDANGRIAAENSAIRARLSGGSDDAGLQDILKADGIPDMKAHISGEGMVFMAHTASGKDIVRIMDAAQATDFANSDECENIRLAVKAEESLPADQRKTSVISLKVGSMESLLQALEPTVKKAVNFADELHEYVSSADKMKAVKETLLSKCEIEQAVGADHYSQFTSKKIEVTSLGTGDSEQANAEKQAEKQAGKEVENESEKMSGKVSEKTDEAQDIRDRVTAGDLWEKFQQAIKNGDFPHSDTNSNPLSCKDHHQKCELYVDLSPEEVATAQHMLMKLTDYNHYAYAGRKYEEESGKSVEKVSKREYEKVKNTLSYEFDKEAGRNKLTLNCQERSVLGTTADIFLGNRPDCGKPMDINKDTKNSMIIFSKSAGEKDSWGLWDYIKDKLHISKSDISAKDQARLMAGEVTSMYSTGDGKECRIRPIADPLTNTLSCEIEYKRDSPDYIGIKDALNLDDRDVENLKRVGVLDHSVAYQGKDVFVYKDKQTNNFLCIEKSSLKIDKKLQEMLSEKEIAQVKEGIPVHCANLIDKQGQRFNGWVLVDPSTSTAVVSRKKPDFVDKDFKIQVANNNNGERAESVKDDKDAALKSKQTTTDDAPKAEVSNKEAKQEPNQKESNPKEARQTYKDYSEDDKSITETTTTKSHKLK